MVPTGAGQTWSPKIACGAGSSSTPSVIISCAPLTDSSAGWKMNLTVPGSRSRIPASTSAVPNRMATWLSWPQACMTPTSCPWYWVRTVDLKGKSTSSVTGRASMSARSATTGPAGGREGGLEGQAHELRDRRGAHVGAERHDRTGACASQHAHHPGPGHAGPHLEAEGGEMLRHQLRRADFGERQLRVLVNVSAPRHHFGQDGGGSGVDLGRQRRGAGLGVERWETQADPERREHEGPACHHEVVDPLEGSHAAPR